MSKRKKKEIGIEEKLEIIGDELVDAVQWIEDSSPFEITCELARFGEKTHNWNEIGEFFDHWQLRKVNGDFVPAFEELLMVWENEIKKLEESVLGESQVLL
ncbi:MAG: hypothetical protein KA715_11150 [Xanthomonadaceae bacterium]|nr:hypothetical protein [Xanthomonadaceae bacterium]